MTTTLRLLSGFSILLLAAAGAAQQPAEPAPAAPAEAMDAAEDVPDYDVLQFTPDEVFIDLRASLAESWAATLAVLTDLHYVVETDLAYLDAGGQITVEDLWLAVEPHVWRTGAGSESFTRLRIAPASGEDIDVIAVRAEVILDAVATRLAPPVIREAVKYSYPFTPATTTVYQTTYVPYYAGPYIPSWYWPSSYWPYCGPYYSPGLSFGAAWWGDHFWLSSGWPGCGWFGNPWWNFGFSVGWGNVCGNFGWPWGWGSCGPWGWPGAGYWNSPVCTMGLGPGWFAKVNTAANLTVAGGAVVADPLVATPIGGAPGSVHARRRLSQTTQVDADAISPRLRGDEQPRPSAGDVEDRPTLADPGIRVTSRERREVSSQRLEPRVVVTRTEPRAGHDGRDDEAGRSPSTPRIVISGPSGSSTPRSGKVVRLSSAPYGSRSTSLPSGRVITGTLASPRDNSGPVSSQPLVITGSGSSSRSSGPSSMPSISPLPVSTPDVVYQVRLGRSSPARHAPSLASPPTISAPPMLSAPSNSSAPRSSGGHGGGSSSAPKPSMTSGLSGPSMPSSAPRSSGSGSSGGGGRGHGKGRP